MPISEITIVNRGLVADGPDGSSGFSVCTFCGFAEEGGDLPEDDEEPEENRGHTLRCPGRADPRAEVIHRGVWLAARIKGDVLEVPLPDATRTEAFAGWRRSFAEALMLGIREAMLAGRRDLDAFERHTRGAPESLVIFDTMPGGTGYLPKLLANDGEGLRQASRAALTILESCDCSGSCHRCLRDFWNQRYHAVLNRHEVLATLRRLAGGSVVHAEEPEDDRLESFLELEFFTKLKEAGLPEPTLQVERHLQSGRITVVDAEYREPDVSVFLDGRAYHAVSREKIESDLRKRNDLEAKGVVVLEFTYRDVMDGFDGVLASVMAARSSGREEPAGEPTVGPGLELISNEGQRAVVAVDPEAWLLSEDARQQSLASANALRLTGWRLERVVR